MSKCMGHASDSHAAYLHANSWEDEMMIHAQRPLPRFCLEATENAFKLGLLSEILVHGSSAKPM